MNLLAQLKGQGLPQMQLQSVFDAIILARVQYASPAWRGYLNLSTATVIYKTKEMANCLGQL